MPPSFSSSSYPLKSALPAQILHAVALAPPLLHTPSRLATRPTRAASGLRLLQTLVGVGRDLLQDIARVWASRAGGARRVLMGGRRAWSTCTDSAANCCHLCAVRAWTGPRHRCQPTPPPRPGSTAHGHAPNSPSPRLGLGWFVKAAALPTPIL